MNKSMEHQKDQILPEDEQEILEKVLIFPFSHISLLVKNKIQIEINVENPLYKKQLIFVHL